jgi:phenylpropionate dioxygenase-like ring-hydroxylating dioxygenase large terminal subunit
MTAIEKISPAAFSRTREELRSARHLPGYVYTSPEILELEKDRIFMRDWLCLGRIEELPNPGDYMALRIVDEPILIVRNHTGQINAFSNVCRHRGVEVAPVGQGNAREFLCPYHSWAYDLDGKLFGAPMMRESSTADLSDCGLPKLPMVVWRGWIFATFDANPAPFDEVIAEFESEFSFLQPERCVLVDKTVLDLDCNWKFVCENLMDIYHIGTVHARSFGSHYKGARERYQFKYFSHGGYSFFFDAAPMTSDGMTKFGKMPWLGDRPESFACLGFNGPNLNISARCDTVRHWTTWPIAPGRTRLISYTLMPQGVPERPHFNEHLKDYISQLTMAIEEDREMVQSLQNGVRSRRFDPGPLARLEGPIHHIMNNYLDELLGPSRNGAAVGIR